MIPRLDAWGRKALNEQLERTKPGGTLEDYTPECVRRIYMAAREISGRHHPKAIFSHFTPRVYCVAKDFYNNSTILVAPDRDQHKPARGAMIRVTHPSVKFLKPNMWCSAVYRVCACGGNNIVVPLFENSIEDYKKETLARLKAKFDLVYCKCRAVGYYPRAYCVAINTQSDDAAFAVPPTDCPRKDPMSSLFLIEPKRDAVKVGEWCALVGGLVVPYGPRSPSRSPMGPTLIVESYNAR